MYNSVLIFRFMHAFMCVYLYMMKCVSVQVCNKGINVCMCI